MKSYNSALVLVLACVSGLISCAGPLENKQDSLPAQSRWPLPHTPKYAQMVGREYRLLQDCYVFEIKGEKYTYPFVAGHRHIGALPHVVTRENIGKTINGLHILEVLPTGTTFKLADVYTQHVASSFKSTRYTFVIDVTRPAKAEPLKLDTVQLTNHLRLTNEPEFLADTVEIVK